MNTAPAPLQTSGAKADLKNMSRPDLEAFALGLNLPAFRGRQIFSWLYRPGVTGFAQMTDLPKALREQLDEVACVSVLQPFAVETSTDGTKKYGFRLTDGAVVESVLIPDKGRSTLCVSSQVGCAMGCTFCLTGKMGFQRNLAPAEIVNQITAVIKTEGGNKKEVLNNLVFMGMGEPLANFDTLLTALKILLDPQGLDFSSRRVTVSTCGLIPRLQDLGALVPVNLAVSLHAPDDETRSALMPINQTYGLDALLAACRSFPLPQRRRITFEYVLIKGMNDSPAQARLLARKLHGIRCKINLLLFNEAEGLPYERPTLEAATRFQEVLLAAGYTATIRASRGADISAACGQLAGKG